MTTLGNAGRVGLVFVVAFAVAALTWYFLRGGFGAANTYSFDVLFTDAKGVTADTPVTLAGVQIGKVQSVNLTQAQQADMKLQIKNTINGRVVRIPKGSRFTIATPLLGTSGTVVVVPPADSAALPAIREGEILKGENTGDLTTSLNKATLLLDQVTLATKKASILLDTANRAANDPAIRRSLTQTLANLDTASSNGARLTQRLNGLLLEDNAQIQALLKQTQSGAQVSLNNIAQTTASIRDTTRENRAEINAIVRNLDDTTSAVAGITGNANTALGGGQLQATVANLKVTTDNLAATTAKFNTIAGNFQSLSGDPKVQSNLRETVENIKNSSEQASYLIARLNKLAGGRQKPAAGAVIVPGVGSIIVPGGGAGTIKTTPAPSKGAPLYLPRVQALYNTREREFRTDIDAVVPFSLNPVTFARVGIYGFGDSNKLILQGGQGLGKSGKLDARAGLYASKLSVGADYGLGKRQTLSLDLYDPNHLHLDVKGTVMLTPDLGVVLGGENINHHGGGTVVGIEYRRFK